MIAQSFFLFTLFSCGETPPPIEGQLPIEAPANGAVDQLVTELKKLHQEEGKTPEGAFKVWLKAIYLIQGGSTDQQAAGWEMLTFLTLPYKDSPGWEKKPANSIFTDRVKGDKDVFRSYAEGATPENGYAMDPEAFSIVVTSKEDSDQGLKMFVKSSGADSPRPVYMKKSNKSDLYFVADHVNTYVGVRPAVDPDKETFE